ncbi:MAG: GNAT family N-acetyltransferase [Clostridiales bacterium]|nr:GNAT family N-acetyltransferase [Clostridiales bacterium]
MLHHVGTQVIETERLILRPFVYEDNEAMLENWAADEQVQSMYCEPVYPTKAAVRELLYKYISSYKKDDYYRWAVLSKENNRCIGQIAFFLVDSGNRFAEIEYCIGSAFQCRGFATEAAKAVIRFGFETVHFHKIQICHMSTNAASKRVIEKCGFHFEGTLRDYFFINGGCVDRLYYSMLESEYEKSCGNGLCG